jgi:hypothetical protein
LKPVLTTWTGGRRVDVWETEEYLDGYLEAVGIAGENQ